MKKIMMKINKYIRNYFLNIIYGSCWRGPDITHLCRSGSSPHNHNALLILFCLLGEIILMTKL